MDLRESDPTKKKKKMKQKKVTRHEMKFRRLLNGPVRKRGPFPKDSQIQLGSVGVRRPSLG